MMKRIAVLIFVLCQLVTSSYGQSNLSVTADGGASNVTATGATLGLNITGTNAFGLTHTNFWGWGTVNATNTLASWANIITNTAITNGVGQTNITGLANNTLYWYRPFSKDASNGLVYAANSISFRTLIGGIVTQYVDGATNIIVRLVVPGNLGTLSVNGVDITGAAGGSSVASFATNSSTATNALNLGGVPAASYLTNNQQAVWVWGTNGTVRSYSHPTNWAAAQLPYDYVQVAAGTFSFNTNTADSNGYELVLTNGVTLVGAGGRTKQTVFVMVGGANLTMLQLCESNQLRSVAIINSNACGFVFPIHIDAKSFLLFDLDVEGETDVLGFPTLGGASATFQTGTVQSCYLQSQWDWQNAHPASSRVDYYNSEFAQYYLWTNSCSGAGGTVAQMVRGGSNTTARFFGCTFNIYTNSASARAILASNSSGSGTNEFHNCLFNLPASALVVSRNLNGVIPLMDNCIFPTNQMAGTAPQYFYGNTNNLANAFSKTTISSVNFMDGTSISTAPTGVSQANTNIITYATIGPGTNFTCNFGTKVDIVFGSFATGVLTGTSYLQYTNITSGASWSNGFGGVAANAQVILQAIGINNGDTINVSTNYTGVSDSMTWQQPIVVKRP